MGRGFSRPSPPSARLELGLGSSGPRVLKTYVFSSLFFFCWCLGLVLFGFFQFWGFFFFGQVRGSPISAYSSCISSVLMSPILCTPLMGELSTP